MKIRSRAIAVLAAMMALAGAAGAAQMSVQVRNGQLRAAPNFLGKPVAAVDYGAVVEIVATQGAWKQVRSPAGQTGWIHESALTKQRIALKAGDSNVQAGASANEVSLAAKGFTEQVEKDFKSKNRNIDFTWVDRMERFKVSPERAGEFLKAGGVTPPAGGAK